MTKILCNLIFIVLAFYSSSQEEEKSRLYISGSISPEMSSVQYFSGNDYPQSNFLVELGNSSIQQRSKFSLTVASNVEYLITDKFRVRAGIHYSSRGVKYLETDADFTVFETFKSKKRLGYHYLGIPIVGMVDVFKVKNISFYIESGVSIDFLLLETKYTSTKITDFTTDDGKPLVVKDRWLQTNFFKDDFGSFQSSLPPTRLNPSFILSFGIDMSLSENNSLRIAPTSRFSLRKMNELGTLKDFYYNLGVNISYVHRLNK